MEAKITSLNVTRRALLGGLAATALLPLMAGCGDSGSPQPASGGKVELPIWSNDDGFFNFFSGRAAALTKKGPFEYDLKQVKTNAGDVITKALAAYQADGDIPGLLGMEISTVSRFMKNNIGEQVLVDLTGKLGAPESDFFASRVDPYRINGKIMGMEAAYTLCTLYNRVDLWEKYKLPATLATWDDYLKVGNELYAKHGVHLGVQAVTDSGYFMSMLMQRDVQMFDSDGKVVIDVREATKILQWIVDAVAGGAIGVVADFWSGPAAGMVKADKAISILGADWMNAYFFQANMPEQAGKWAISVPPVFAEGGFKTSVSGGTGFAVSKNHPAAEAAVKLLQDGFGTVDGQVQKFLDQGYLPTLKAAWEDSRVTAKEDEFLGGQKVMDVYKPLAESAPTQPQAERYAALVAAANTEVPNAFQGKKTAEQAIKDIIAAANR
ncbi:ABC transporter substrate-binding protein [Microbacterium sp. NPDC057650]|uniref:ABC transporter substrate-binding protein n=1 Tax=unclassified Microbacterium TaxID=2609290 RepID=UPI003671DBF2